jgi:hypothetical protein
MHKEIEIHHSELKTLARNLADIFIQRKDLYPRQLDDGSYICVYKPLRDWHLRAHLEGKITLGTYILDRNCQARFAVLDADDEDQMGRLIQTSRILDVHGVTSYLEASRRGGHMWLFFDQPMDGQEVRAFGKGLAIAHELEGIELFPKQARLKSGPGSLIRLPFGIHRKTGQRYDFVSVDGLPLRPNLVEQIYMLSKPQRVQKSFFAAYRDLGYQNAPKPVLSPSETSEGSLSERIKDSITVMEFVSQFVEISPAGRGLCPFHNDQHASFSVNVEENYWHCFAGCGGGSVIDFWMKWQNCDFTTSLRELAQILLQ